MTLFKISVRNIRRSVRDYAIYFFTLILGVSIFYVFNAIETQTAFVKISESTRDMMNLLSETLSGVSVVVACILGILVVYASRFLMKRRNSEFALYMLLGMGKGKTALLLLVETVLIGLLSLIAGLFIGVALSQLMSTLVASLFQADMSAFSFTFSRAAFVKTILYFAVIMFVVLIFEIAAVGKSRLLSLMQSGRRSEAVKAVHPAISTVLFLIAAGLLVWAYRTVLPGFSTLTREKLLLVIIVGCAATYLIFFSLAGFLFAVLSSAKRTYFRGINCFTLRQITSRLHTMVVSMTVICLLLFAAIAGLSASLSVRGAMNDAITELAPADCNLVAQAYTADGKEKPNLSVSKVFSENGVSLSSYFKEYVEVPLYRDETLTYGDLFCDIKEDVLAENPQLDLISNAWLLRLSDYNAAAEIYGQDTYTLQDDTYLILCNFGMAEDYLNRALSDGTKITAFERELAPAFSTCKDGFLKMDGTHTNTGIVVVPDSVISKDTPVFQSYFIGNYRAKSDEEIEETEAALQFVVDAVDDTFKDETDYGENAPSKDVYYLSISRRTDIMEQSIGLAAFATFLGLYLGLIFLISCAAILALKSMSEQLDMTEEYRMLRRLGVKDRAIDQSLFLQEGFFFLLPLLLAIVHAVVGIRSVKGLLGIFGDGLFAASLITAAILVVIYGGYFAITYLSSRGIVRRAR